MSSKSTRKTVVLDTSVLIAAGKQPLFAFEGQEVVVPLIVLRELEKLREDPEKGYTARLALRALNELANNDTKQLLNQHVIVDKQGGTVTVELNHISTSKLPETLKSGTSNDMRILAVAKNLMEEGRDVKLVTNDLPLGVIAKSIGIHSEEFVGTLSYHGGDRAGVETHYVDGEVINELYRNHTVVVKLELDEESTLEINYGVVLCAHEGNKQVLTIVDKFDKIDGTVTLKQVRDQTAFGMKPTSSEQRFAIDHLLNKNVEIVSLGGRAGTGKTAIAIASGLEAIFERKEFEKIIVFRSPHAVGGQDLGHLPGSEAEKMAPWSAAVWDALSSVASENVRAEVEEQGLLEILPMTHIRGRTFVNSYIIIDEAQNLEIKDIMTALTRVGKGSKAVLTWDVTQRDNLRVGRHNGVVAAVNVLFGHDIFAHTTLVRSERSNVAMIASQALEDLCI